MSSSQPAGDIDFLALEDRYTSGVYPKRKLTIVRGAGARLWDDQGREYIDCIAGIGSGNVGHAHPRVQEAVARQAGRLILCPETFHNDQRALLLARLVELCPRARRAFLCNSGTEAIEGALKFARVSTRRIGVVAAMRGFHGRTMGALSATWDPHYRTPFEPLVPAFTHVPYDDLAKLDAAVTDQTAAVLLEVVQGEGGIRPASADFLRGAQALCRERGALLILDEVQTGLGRTGRLFAFQHHDLEPDLVCVAKSLAAGVPAGAILMGERVGPLPPRVHGSTFGGNPLSCAAALATLDVIVSEDLPARAARLGERLLSALHSLESPRIREVRGRGLMVGVELREKVAPLIQALTDRGVLALGAGATVLRLLPPLVISEEDLDRVVEALRDALEAPGAPERE